MEKHFKPRQSAQLLWDNITLTALQSHSQSNSFPDKILHFTIRFSSLNFSNLPMINSEQRFENLLARSLHALLCQELLSDFSPFKISNGMSRLLFCSNFPEHSCSLSPSPTPYLPDLPMQNWMRSISGGQSPSSAGGEKTLRLLPTD